MPNADGFESFNEYKQKGGLRDFGTNDTTPLMTPNENADNSASWYDKAVASFADIKDSIARSNAYGAPGHGYMGSFVNGQLAVSRGEAEAMGSGEEYADKIAETLAQGITRQGGNY